MSNETTLDDVLALVALATPGAFAGNMRRDESIYVSVGDPLKGPHAQGDVYLPCPDVDAMVSALNYLRAHGDELRAALEDARRWREYAAAGRGDHSHCCKSCWHPYTPARGESEDCPKCGYDGISAIDAAQDPTP